MACLLIIMFSIPLNMYLGEDVKTQVIRWIKAALYAAGDSYTAPLKSRGSVQSGFCGLRFGAV